jgi:hypothetical protein
MDGSGRTEEFLRDLHRDALRLEESHRGPVLGVQVDDPIVAVDGGDEDEGAPHADALSGGDGVGTDVDEFGHEGNDREGL